MSKYSLKFLMSQSFPFNSARARSALLTRGNYCAQHLSFMVKFSITNEGSIFWETLVNHLGSTPQMTLFSCPPIVSLLDNGPIDPWFAVARMLVASEIWTERGLTPPVSNSYLGFSALDITVDPVYELDNLLGMQMMAEPDNSEF